MAVTLGFKTHIISDASATVEKSILSGRLWTADEVHALSVANLAGEYVYVLTTEELLTRASSKSCELALGWSVSPRRREIRGRRYLDQFQIIRMVNLTVMNAGRLMDTVTCLEPDFTLAFVLEYRPTLEDIDHLKFKIVSMPTDPLAVSFSSADHMGMEFTSGRFTNPQITVLEECA